jgi:hypothetical protein
MHQWYFVTDGQRRGPVSIDELGSLVRVGTITGDTPMWAAERGGDWVPARTIPELAALGFAPPVPRADGPAPGQFSAPGLTPPASTEDQRYYAAKASGYTEQGFRSLFTWYWILSGPLLILILPLIAGAVLGYILLYRHWVMIQDGRARTTPGQAVGFSFIPIFNLYWMFVAIHGLAQDMNAYVRREKIAVNPVSESLALATCILLCCSIIPLLGYVTLLAAIIMTIFVKKQMNDVAIAILRARRAAPATA